MSTLDASEKSAEIIRRAYARTPKWAPRTALDESTAADDTDPADGSAADDSTTLPHGSSGTNGFALEEGSTLANGTTSDHTEEDAVPEIIDGTQNSGDVAMGEPRLLRILSGPHFGAEMSLRPGRYAIGTDENCDIVLSDTQLAARHAFLILSDDQVSVEPGDGAVTVDGTRVDGRVVVADFTPVLMGNTTLA